MNALQQIERLQKHLGLNNQEMAAELRITPEWFSKITNEHRKISEDIILRANDLARRNQVDLSSSVATQVKNPVNRGTLKLGGSSAGSIEEGGGIYDPVASRLPQRREPSNRADCLAYVLQLLDAAEASGNPDNFPAIMARLKKQFPLDEWDEKPE